MQVFIGVPVIVLIISVYLVIAPIVDDPLIQYLIAFLLVLLERFARNRYFFFNLYFFCVLFNQVISVKM